MVWTSRVAAADVSQPVMVAAAVLDFFPIEGTRKTVREVRSCNERLRPRKPNCAGRRLSPPSILIGDQEAALDFSTISIRCRSTRTSSGKGTHG